jgi:hypothetical protein
MTRGIRRLIIALAIAAPSMLAIALGAKMVGGPIWVVFTLICIAMCLLGALLIIVDGVTCEMDGDAWLK